MLVQDVPVPAASPPLSTGRASSKDAAGSPFVAAGDATALSLSRTEVAGLSIPAIKQALSIAGFEDEMHDMMAAKKKALKKDWVELYMSLKR